MAAKHAGSARGTHMNAMELTAAAQAGVRRSRRGGTAAAPGPAGARAVRRTASPASGAGVARAWAL